MQIRNNSRIFAEAKEHNGYNHFNNISSKYRGSKVSKTIVFLSRVHNATPCCFNSLSKTRD